MIVAGFGFTTRASRDSLADALRQTGWAARIDRLATVADKAAALQELAQAMHMPCTTVPQDALHAVETSTQSSAAQAARQTGSVAEAAALAAAGPNATLIVTRCISTDRMATCAIATGDPI
ncbi:MAG: cobalamin biosynthesis protein [Pseudomonadota bacterium]